ncbi:acyltransferase [Demequina sp. NBRC 110056]|uniref:acyltransferase family protein n=1 Tax=Demequina sp. NBRC 110056 TaxID=1570345 RepID=UPI000A0037D4|nr:acyltransferase [Demequina sp. NBRC 110056]
MSTARNSRFELLRVVAMLAIVGHHYAIHSGVMYHTESRNTDLFLLSAGGFGNFGVDLFVLVGAYFMVDRPRRGKALSSIYSQALPVSWIILALALTTGFVVPTPTEIRDGLAPVIFGQWWFVTTYVLLILIAPYLAIVARSLTAVQLRRLVLGGVVMWSVLTMIDGVTLVLSDLAWFVLLFFAAAYVRLHGVPGSARAWLAAALSSIAALFVLLLAVGSVRYAILDVSTAMTWPRDEFASKQSLPTLVAAACTFVWAVKGRPWSSRVINTWAGATFAVYLIHDNRMLRRWLWPDVVDAASAAGQWWLPLHFVAGTLAVYVGCTLVVFVLQRTVFRWSHRATEALRLRVERRLRSPHDEHPPAAGLT